MKGFLGWAGTVFFLFATPFVIVLMAVSIGGWFGIDERVSSAAGVGILVLAHSYGMTGVTREPSRCSDPDSTS
jgi:hypothetical protein